MTADFSSEAMGAIRKWHNIIHVQNKQTKNTCQSRILYPVKTSFKNEGEIKAFSVEGKLRKFFASRPALKK